MTGVDEQLQALTEALNDGRLVCGACGAHVRTTAGGEYRPAMLADLQQPCPRCGAESALAPDTDPRR
jgi:ribosomal protein S27AE